VIFPSWRDILIKVKSSTYTDLVPKLNAVVSRMDLAINSGHFEEISDFKKSKMKFSSSAYELWAFKFKQI